MASNSVSEIFGKLKSYCFEEKLANLAKAKFSRNSVTLSKCDLAVSKNLLQFWFKCEQIFLHPLSSYIEQICIKLLHAMQVASNRKIELSGIGKASSNNHDICVEKCT